jgi:hypothetical protein
VSVDRVGLVIVEMASAFHPPEEVAVIEIEAATNLRLELPRAEQSVDVSQRAEVVAGVEIVDPLLRLTLTVRPRPVVVLAVGRVAGGLERRIEKLRVAGQAGHAAEQRAGQEVGVVDLGRHRRQRITETDGSSAIRPV